MNGWFSWSLVTALIWGIAPLVEKLGLAKVEPLLAISVRSFTVSLVLLVVLLASGQLPRLAAVGLRPALFLGTGGLLAALLAQWTYYVALKRGLVSSVVPVAGAYPVIGVLLAALFLGEKLTLVKLLGALLVVAGVVLIKLPA